MPVQINEFELMPGAEEMPQTPLAETPSPVPGDMPHTPAQWQRMEELRRERAMRVYAH